MSRPRQKESQMPAFTALMIRHGLLFPNCSSDAAFGLWLRICEDPIVRERSRKREARKKPAYLTSVAAGYAHASSVLNAMTPKEVQQLRERLGVQHVS
jgi:hypothetical protein